MGEWNPSFLALDWGMFEAQYPKLPVKTGCGLPLHDLHDIRPRLVSSFYMSSFPWDLTGFSGRIFFFFNFGSTRSSLREGNGTPLQYSCLENPMNREAWKAAGHGVTEGRTWLRDFTFMHWERNGNPLHCSCLENPRDRRDWRADIYGNAKSRTRLKWLSSSSRSSLLLRTSLFSARRGYSVMAVH